VKRPSSRAEESFSPMSSLLAETTSDSVVWFMSPCAKITWDELEPPSLVGEPTIPIVYMPHTFVDAFASFWDHVVGAV
jgi:hypothetical protein